MMEFDFNGMLFALSYALDCVEHDVVGVTTNHGKRVAALSIRLGEKMNLLHDTTDRQALAACAVMHDSALSEYIQEEFNGSYEAAKSEITHNLGEHCTLGEKSMKLMPVPYEITKDAVLYHHENADGSGAFGKKWSEIPEFARLIQITDMVDAHFDMSWLIESKINKIIDFINDGIGTLFGREEAEAFIEILKENDLCYLRNEKLSLHLREILPNGRIKCTAKELIDFASVFARIVDYKSHFTKTHSIGIARKAWEMAKFYGEDDEFAAKMYFAGALHDIGKLVVDRDVLEKPDKLNSMEYEHIQTHAYYSYRILSDIPGIDDITKWASLHHEKLDGTGYPFGLTGDRLGRWERLMACLDIYQALTEERPYKAGMQHSQAMGILGGMAADGKLDADIVEDIDEYYGEKKK